MELLSNDLLYSSTDLVALTICVEQLLELCAAQGSLYQILIQLF